jgi:hypothetical protein
MRRIVYTVAIGELDYFQLTLPTIRAYAERIGAAFVLADKATVFPDNPYFPHFEKFGLGRPLWGDFDWVCFIDADCLVRNDCPDLFGVVPEHALGMLNELEYCTSHNEEFAAKLVRCQKFYGLTPIIPDFLRMVYYNTGVMVVPRSAQEFFFPPPRPFPFQCYDQDVLNMRLTRCRRFNDFNNYPEIYSLDSRFNHMMWYGFMAGPKEDAYILHYAAMDNKRRMVAMKNDLAEWQERGLA